MSEPKYLKNMLLKGQMTPIKRYCTGGDMFSKQMLDLTGLSFSSGKVIQHRKQIGSIHGSQRYNCHVKLMLILQNLANHFHLF
jgi:hypothetical protein